MKKKWIIIIGFCCVISIAFLSIFSNRSDSKTVNYNGNNLMVSVDGAEVSELPTSGDYYLASYDCKSKNTVVIWDRKNYQLLVSNGSKKGGVSCYLDFKTNPNLSEMVVGSYVEYVGNNGCVGNSCSGDNSGSCDSSKYKYSGFRLAYVSDVPYLISAGAIDCGNQGDISQKVLKYCNSDYVYDGSCDSSNVRGIAGEDFNYISQGMSMGLCHDVQNKKCGYTNELIDIGGDYWYSDAYQGNNSFYWSSLHRSLLDSSNDNNLGIRAVIKLDNNVIVVGGDGTKDNPYKISNNSFMVLKYNKDDKTVDLKMMGYQIKEMCINFNSTVCTNYVPFKEEYSLDVSNMLDDKNVIYVYYKDNDGKIIHTLNREFSLKNV